MARRPWRTYSGRRTGLAAGRGPARRGLALPFKEKAALNGRCETADRRSMDPPLRERLSWRSSIEESAPASRAAMARTGAVFGAAAGLFALVSVAVPATAVNDRGLLL